MKNKVKKLLALLSAAVFSFSTVSGSLCSAEETAPAYADSIQTGTDITVQGTDAFGNMLAAELQSAQDEQIENSGQNIFSVEMTGKTAALEYAVTEDCSAVVGIYDESGTTMLASGNADLSAEENTATLTIGIDEMPQYYYIKAFLIDKHTMRPLCSVYENPMYTQEMQEFLAKTTDDFEADKVYNLDDDKTNNFAVFNDSVTVLDAEPIYSGSGRVIFGSITDEIKALTPGSTFAYYYKEQLYIYDVTSVTIDEEKGQTEIAFTDNQTAELEDVFDYVKVDGEALAENCTATPTGDADEGVTYLGMTVEAPEEEALAYGTAQDISDGSEIYGGVNIGGTATVSYEFKIEKEFKTTASGINDETATTTGKLSAALRLSASASAKVYISFSEQYVEMKLDYSAKISASFTGSTKIEVPLGQELGFAVCPGVYVGITPKIIGEISASITLAGTLSGTVGFRCDSRSITNLTTTPKFETKLTVEGKFYIGFSLCPRLTLVSKYVASAGAEAQVGVTMTAKSDILQADPYQLVKHNCKTCITGDITAKAKVGFDVKLLNLDSLKFQITAFEKSWKLFDFYYSDISGFNIGSCPNKEYKTKIYVCDNFFDRIDNAVISVDGKEISRDSYETEIFLTTETHTFKAESPSFRTASKEMEIKAVKNTPNEITILMYSNEYSGSGGISIPNPGDISSGGSGETDDPSIDIGISKNRLSLGDYRSAYITENGDLYTWGDNGFGQLGDGTTTDSYTPVKIMSNVAQVSLGSRHSACITTNGDLYTWGYNSSGQLGDGTTTGRYTPVKIMSNVAQVSLGSYYGACITTNGDLYTWGDNSFGQLGNGTDANRYTPVKIMSNVASISLGDWHSAAITTSGDLYTWGDNSYGQLGNGTDAKRYTPVKIMNNVAQVSLGFDHSACITTNGDLYTWGGNYYGQLGDGTTTDRYTPVKIMSNVAQVSLGCEYSAFITTNGDLYTWGGNSDGQLGDGTITRKYTPAKIMSNVAQVSLGYKHSACITTNGDLYTWGRNSDGQLGDGTTKKRYTPTKITIPPETTTDLQSEYLSASSSQQFTELLPNEVYNIYSMSSRTAEDPFSSDNLLYIDQKMSDSSGTLSVEISTDKNGIAPEIFVKAMNGGEINNAEITSLEYSENTASVGWEAVEGAKKYTVYTIRNGIFIKETDTADLSYTAGGLMTGKEYGFIVQAWVNGEYSVLDKADAVYFIPEKQESIDDYIEIVNGIAEEFLTDEQLEAVEKVLDNDYSKIS